MISNPRHGWCEFRLGNFCGTPSDLTDVPLDLLVAFIRYFRQGSAVCAFDEKDDESLLVMDAYTGMVFVIEGGELRFSGTLDAKRLAQDLINDIEGDLNEWQYFTTRADDPEEVKVYRDELWDKIAQLKKLLSPLQKA